MKGPVGLWQEAKPVAQGLGKLQWREDSGGTAVTVRRLILPAAPWMQLDYWQCCDHSEPALLQATCSTVNLQNRCQNGTSAKPTEGSESDSFTGGAAAAEASVCALEIRHRSSAVYRQAVVTARSGAGACGAVMHQNTSEECAEDMPYGWYSWPDSYAAEGGQVTVSTKVCS